SVPSRSRTRGARARSCARSCAALSCAATVTAAPTRRVHETVDSAGKKIIRVGERARRVVAELSRRPQQRYAGARPPAFHGRASCSRRLPLDRIGIIRSRRGIAMSKPKTNKKTNTTSRSAAVLVLLAAPLALSGRAEAACDPASPIDNATVTCRDATVNQNGINGYGDGNDTGNTINILSGASVTGTVSGLGFHDATVNNSGLVSGRGNGILGASVTLNNDAAGVINAGPN